MGRPQQCNPCCGRDGHRSDPEYCTHRRYTDNGASADVDWSRSISPTGSIRAVATAMTVGDDGTLYVSGFLNPLTRTVTGHTLLGVPIVSMTAPAHVVEAWSADGELLWRTGVPTGVHTLTYSGSALWAGGDGEDSNIWKFNPSTGAILVSKRIDFSDLHATVEGHIQRFYFQASVDDGAGGVWFAGNAIVRVDSAGDLVSGAFGGQFFEGGPALGVTLAGEFFGIDRDGADLYLAGRMDFVRWCGELRIVMQGLFGRIGTDYEVDWIWNPFFDPATSATNIRGRRIKVHNDDAYGLASNGCLVRMDNDTAIGEIAIQSGGADLAVSDTGTVYVAGTSETDMTGQFLSAYDSDLVLQWCERHAGMVDGDVIAGRYHAVAVGSGGGSGSGSGSGGGDEAVYAGGSAAGCDTSGVDPVECTDGECDLRECLPGEIGPRGGITAPNCGCESELPCGNEDDAEDPPTLCLFGGTGGLADWNGPVELEWDADRRLIGSLESACGTVSVRVEMLDAAPHWKIFFSQTTGRGDTPGLEKEGTVTGTFCEPVTDCGHAGFDFTFEIEESDLDEWAAHCCEAGTISGTFGECPDDCADPECGDCGDPHYNPSMAAVAQHGYLVNCGCEPVPCEFTTNVPSNDCNLSGSVNWVKEAGSLTWNGTGTWSCGGTSGTWAFITTFDCAGGGMMDGWSISGSYTVNGVGGSTALSITIVRTWCAGGAHPSVPFPGFWFTFAFSPCSCTEIDMPGEVDDPECCVIADIPDALPASLGGCDFTLNRTAPGGSTWQGTVSCAGLCEEGSGPVSLTVTMSCAALPTPHFTVLVTRVVSGGAFTCTGEDLSPTVSCTPFLLSAQIPTDVAGSTPGTVPLEDCCFGSPVDNPLDLLVTAA